MPSEPLQPQQQLAKSQRKRRRSQRNFHSVPELEVDAYTHKLAKLRFEDRAAGYAGPRPLQFSRESGHPIVRSEVLRHNFEAQDTLGDKVGVAQASG